MSNLRVLKQFHRAFRANISFRVVSNLRVRVGSILTVVSRFFEAGRVYFLNGANKIQELHDQLMEFPNGTHDDMVDALVYAVRMLLVEGGSVASEGDFLLDGEY